MPTPFFGIGAMRAGTTWLSELLERYADCRMMPIKELHFFDIRYGKYHGPQYYRPMARRLAAASQKVAKRITTALDDVRKGAGKEEIADAGANKSSINRTLVPWTDEIMRTFFSSAALDEDLRRITEVVDYLSIRDTSSYVEYLRRHGAGATAFGEISPAYSLLPTAAFAEMDRLLPNARFIFIMRDPIERLWSQIRYKQDRAEQGGRSTKDANIDFSDALQQTNATGRSQYDHTIEALEKAIPTDRILYLFYETLTSPETGPGEVRRIEAALGLKHREPDPKFFSKPVNASSPAKLTSENEAAAMQLFASVYALVEKRFGRQPRWRSPSEPA